MLFEYKYMLKKKTKPPYSENKITNKHYQEPENRFRVCLGFFFGELQKNFWGKLQREKLHIQQVTRTEKDKNTD